MSDGDVPIRVRLDKWLWAARFFKTRSLAAQAIDGGKVDVNGERIETYRDPSPAGYRSRHLDLRGEQLAPAFKPDLVIDVDAILGPPDEGTGDREQVTGDDPR